MCWSGEASATLAAIGLSTTVYAAYKKEPTPLWMALGYFSLMEALQAYTYSVINQCGNPANQIATLLGYLHICFQPFFINAVSLHFVPRPVREKVGKWAYILCFGSAIFMIIQLYPFPWAGHCDPGRPLCGDVLCSVRGNWHIAWIVPTNGICNSMTYWFDGFPTYVIVGFILPVLYGAWRITLYHYAMGPFLAWMTTSNLNEWPAVWCLLSIALLTIVVKTPIRRFMYQKQWFLWPDSIRRALAQPPSTVAEQTI